ncbi:MAG: phosphotransferase [Flavobacteriaceae bacterium]|nr:phosphotransferase [Flavobacteriaceae bacterium]
MTQKEEFLKTFTSTSTDVEKIIESGSGRSNFRFKTKNDSYILTQSDNVKENQTFFYLSNLFDSLNGNVPEVLSVSKDETMYIQDDLGDTSLLDLRLRKDTSTMTLYELTVKKLVHLQVGAHQIIDYSKLYESNSLDKMLVHRDLFYFKNYFLDLLDFEYSQAELLNEFEKISDGIEKTRYRYFIFRDFQGRNILIKDNKPYFIDFQDGMEGPIAYDLVSLLWQAKAQLSDEEKSHLYNIYTQELQQLLPNLFVEELFRKDYYKCVLIRLMQVVGAYGKLGIMQQKRHFKESLVYGIQNLKKFNQNEFMNNYPVLKSIFEQLDELQIPKIKA